MYEVTAMCLIVRNFFPNYFILERNVLLRFLFNNCFQINQVVP